MFRRGGPILILIGLLALPASASAAPVTFGADMTQSPTFSTQQFSITNVIAPDGSTDNGAPASGILVSARIRTAGGGGTGVIRVLRETSHPDFATYGLLNTAPEIPVTVTADATPAGHVTEVLTRRPIAAGDRLAWYVNDPGSTIKEQVPGAPGDCAYANGASHTLGSSLDYTRAGCNNLLVLLSGTVEPDADGDGFGDDSQDQCPTNASTQGPCPATPVTTSPPHKKKCKKKKHRSAEVAKKKKCKKKRR